MKMTKFICGVVASFAVLYGASSQAAFTGGVSVIVDGNTTVSGGLNSGVDFNDGLPPLPVTLNDSIAMLSSVGGGSVETSFLFASSNPFLDIDFTPLLNDPASTALDGQVMMSLTDFSTFATIELTFDSLIAIVPTSNNVDTGSVDFAGLGTLTYNGAEATEVFWQYNIGVAAVGVNIDTAGAGSTLNNFNSSAVPVPAALWLFVSALLAVGGVKRVQR